MGSTDGRAWKIGKDRNAPAPRCPGETAVVARFLLLGAPWGNPVLQLLGERLVQEGWDLAAADHLVECVWVFHSYFLLPLYQHNIAILIVVGRDPERVADFRCTLMIPHQRDKLDGLVQAFQALLERGTRLDGWSVNGVVEMRPYDSITLAIAGAQEEIFVSMYEDQLSRDLETILDLEDFASWKTDPNVLFGGDPPVSVMDNLSDRRPRDLILSARHGPFA